MGKNTKLKRNKLTIEEYNVMDKVEQNEDEKLKEEMFKVANTKISKPRKIEGGTVTKKLPVFKQKSDVYMNKNNIRLIL